MLMYKRIHLFGGYHALDNLCDSDSTLAVGITSYTMGGLIHILLVIAIIVVLVRIIQGRRPL